MILWASLAVVLFSLLPIYTRAEVVDSFQSCSGFFYQSEEPRGFDQNAKKICQKMNYKYFYASLYSTYHRIPVYSAYNFDYGCNRETRPSNWYIEPQLSKDQIIQYTNMDNMKLYTSQEADLIMFKQAINEDYSSTGYDKGHLNPNSFQCNEGRRATFTLTNAAPMNPTFNRKHWKNCEAGVRSILDAQDRLGTAYLVTGTVTSNNQMNYRVTVPSHVWTAVCYIHPNNPEKSFSFAVIGENKEDGSISIKTVEQLTQDLSEKYNNNNLRIFKDNCFFPKSQNSETGIQLGNRIAKPTDVMNAILVVLGQSDPPIVSSSLNKIELTYNDINSWQTSYEKIKLVSNLACSLTTPLTSNINVELRRRRSTSQKLVCRLVSEKITDSCPSCLYNRVASDYYCSVLFDGEQAPCSPTYSDVTVSGETCRSDNTCGKHGYSYYWCYTDWYNNWDYCSAPPPLGVTREGKQCSVSHKCEKHGNSYPWCNTDDGNWDYCCKKAGRFNAVSGKFCKLNSPCDYYGSYKLWCHTTDGSWDYCCTNKDL